MENAGLRRKTISALVGAVCVAAAPCAAAQVGANTVPLRVFQAGQITPDRYTVIQRLWVGSWRSAFWVPAYADAASAIGALEAEAARLGADGVINLGCLEDRGGWLRRDSFFCYGNAIRLK